MKYYDNNIYPIGLVLTDTFKDLEDNYTSYDGSILQERKEPQAVTYIMSRKTDSSYYAMAVGICFNVPATARLAAHEGFHAVRYMLEFGLHVPLDDNSEEAWAYLAGWVADCIDDYRKQAEPSEGESNDTNEYVDLGLPSGTLWATCNVGAGLPEEYGDLVSWNDIGDYSTVPTKEQFQELLGNTKLERTTIGDTYGIKFKSSNGNSIFLPAAGYGSDITVSVQGSIGYYWSSTPYGNDSVYIMSFNSDNLGVDRSSRNYGCSIRCVKNA